MHAATLINNDVHENNPKEKAVQYCEFKNFVQKKHSIKTKTLNKVSLCSYETKRHWLNTIDSLPHGHKDIGKVTFEKMKTDGLENYNIPTAESIFGKDYVEWKKIKNALSFGLVWNM